MKKYLFWIATIALGVVACTDKDIAPAESAQPDQVENNQTAPSNLTTVKLATFAGNPNRISYEAGSRADEEALKPLELIASIANPSKAEGFNFNLEEGGRYLSATSVYYNPTTETYYATYHMQGNNYNTTLDNEIGGTIQQFKVTNNGSEYEVVLGNGFRAEDPNKLDYDFNHLYFDVTSNRIIAVGHQWEVPKTWESDEVYTGKRDNTNAIIALFDPEDATLTSSKIYTAEKLYDADGKSLGKEGAGDANCVIRGGETMNPNHVYGWNIYYVATRKGMAVLHADEEKLFESYLNEDGTNYFIPTPGSAKFVAKTGTSSFFDLLYLAEDNENESYSSSSPAKIAHFATNTGENNSFGYLTEVGTQIKYNPQEKNILEMGKQSDIVEVITPIDGKNTLLCAPECYSDNEQYAALGANGVYYHFNGVNSGKEIEGVLKIKGSNKYLPVNCVTADVSSDESGHDGFMYIACGARLIIVHRKTFEVVAYWNIPTKDENGDYLDDVAASANYIHVQHGPVVSYENDRKVRERIITVAFGQEGLKVFRFNPATLERKTVWEKELPTEIVCD